MRGWEEGAESGYSVREGVNGGGHAGVQGGHNLQGREVQFRRSEVGLREKGAAQG